jgi:NAD(P)-dependent dehydrogenase (short-subunit alcohol dehydrogenase family)
MTVAIVPVWFLWKHCLALELASKNIRVNALCPVAGEARLARFSPVTLRYAMDRGTNAPSGDDPKRGRSGALRHRPHSGVD